MRKNQGVTIRIGIDSGMSGESINKTESPKESNIINLSLFTFKTKCKPSVRNLKIEIIE